MPRFARPAGLRPASHTHKLSRLATLSPPACGRRNSVRRRGWRPWPYADGVYSFSSWPSATAITLTTTHSPCRRGLAAVGRVRAAPHPPLPLRGECVAHTSSNQHITLLSTPLFSSHLLSSLLSCYSSTAPLFFHTHLHTPSIHFTQTCLLKSKTFYTQS